MTKYLNQQEVIQKMQQGWKLEEKRNFNGTKILSYWLGKRGERQEHFLTKKTRKSLLDKGIIDANNMLK